MCGGRGIYNDDGVKRKADMTSILSLYLLLALTYKGAWKLLRGIDIIVSGTLENTKDVGMKICVCWRLYIPYITRILVLYIH